MIETWVLEKLDPLRKEPLIFLRDPQRRNRRGARAVDGWTEEVRDDPSVKVLLVDRTRDQAKLPLFFPTWSAAARLGPSWPSPCGAPSKSDQMRMALG